MSATLTWHGLKNSKYASYNWGKLLKNGPSKIF